VIRCGLITSTQPDSLPPPLYAGFWRRVGAHFVDWLLVTLVAMFSAGIAIAGASLNKSAMDLAIPLVMITAAFLYFAVMESSTWQATLGKKAFAIQVTDLAGSRISLGRASARFFAKLLSILPFYAGLLITAFTPKKQALHDFIAGTLVVRKPGTYVTPSVARPVPTPAHVPPPSYAGANLETCPHCRQNFPVGKLMNVLIERDGVTTPLLLCMDCALRAASGSP